MYDCCVANGNMAPELGVKEGMREGSGPTHLQTVDGDNGVHCHHHLHVLAGGDDMDDGINMLLALLFACSEVHVGG